MNLAELQALFHGVLRGEISADDARVAAEMVSDSRLPAHGRLEIYEEMYWARQTEALQAEFPMLAKLLGDCAFADLSRAYLKAHPSEHPDIGHLGRKLAEFIRDHAGVRKDLSELAALERARSLSFGALDAEPCSWDELAALGPEGFVSARLAFVPSLRTFEARFDLTALWSALQADEKPNPVALEAPVTVAVWKNGFEVFHAPLADAEAQALASAIRGGTLGEVCEAFAAAEDPAGTAFKTLASWFNEGWVAAIAPADA